MDHVHKSTAGKSRLTKAQAEHRGELFKGAIEARHEREAQQPADAPKRTFEQIEAAYDLANLRCAVILQILAESHPAIIDQIDALIPCTRDALRQRIEADAALNEYLSYSDDPEGRSAPRDGPIVERMQDQWLRGPL